MAKAFKGTIWVDEAAREVVRVEATRSTASPTAFGLIARLNEGTRSTLVARARSTRHLAADVDPPDR